MKKALIIFMCLTLVASVFVTPAYAEEGVSVVVNGTEISFNDQKPVIMSGRTLVPARAVFEFLGASVYWDETETGGYVSVVTGKKSVVLEVNRETKVNYMTVDNLIKVALDVPATIIGGRTLVPLRAIGDALSVEVGWDGATRTASLNYTMPQEDKLSYETNEKNETFKYAMAEADCEKIYGFNPLSDMPLYKDGLKRYEGISAEKEKKYINVAGKTPVYEPFEIFAVVDDIIISADELEYYKKMYADPQGQITEDYIARAKNEAILTAVSVNYALKSGVEYDAELVEGIDYYLYSVCYGLDISTFASMVGTTPEVVYAFAENSALRNALYQKAIKNGEVDISDEAINKIFEELFYKAKHILFKTVDNTMNPLSKSEISKQKKLAENTLAKLEKGADFDKLMRDLSEDSAQSFDGYVFTSGQMVSAFENGVKALKFGEISNVIESEYGYHIILRMQLSAEEEAETVSQYRSAIINYIGAKYFENTLPEWSKEMNIRVY